MVILNQFWPDLVFFSPKFKMMAVPSRFKIDLMDFHQLTEQVHQWDYYYIDRRIYLNLSKSTQSVAGLKTLKPAANGRYWINVKIITLLFTFKYIYPPVSKVHAGSFRVSVIHRTQTWPTGSLMSVHDHSYACVYTRRGWAHQQQVSTCFTRKSSQIVLALLTGFEPRVIESWVNALPIEPPHHPDAIY